MEYIGDDDIGFMHLKEGEVARTLERKPRILVDVDREGCPLSTEIVGWSKTTATDLLKVLEEFVVFLPARPRRLTSGPPHNTKSPS